MIWSRRNNTAGRWRRRPFWFRCVAFGFCQDSTRYTDTVYHVCTQFRFAQSCLVPGPSERNCRVSRGVCVHKRRGLEVLKRIRLAQNVVQCRAPLKAIINAGGLREVGVFCLSSEQAVCCQELVNIKQNKTFCALLRVFILHSNLI
jgi:hypothetical protein